MATSPKTFTSHSPPRARTLSGPATRLRWTRELLQTRNRAFGPNGVPTTSRQTSATRTDTTSRLPVSLGSTNKRYEPSTHLRPAPLIRPLAILTLHATSRTSACSWDSLPTDQASETALPCSLMWRREPFDVDLSNAMPGIMPGDFERKRADLESLFLLEET